MSTPDSAPFAEPITVVLRNNRRAILTRGLARSSFCLLGHLAGDTKHEAWKITGHYREDNKAHAFDIVAAVSGDELVAFVGIVMEGGRR